MMNEEIIRKNPKRIPPLNRQQVLERLDSLSYRDPNSGCWIWLGMTQFGYARCHYEGFPAFNRAHRLSYYLYRGPIPDNLVLDHLCRVRECINPWHLEPVTLLENIKRGVHVYQRTRNGRKTHCHNGHEFTEENTYVGIGTNGNPMRSCRQCAKIKAQLRYDLIRKRPKR